MYWKTKPWIATKKKIRVAELSVRFKEPHANKTPFKMVYVV